MTSAEFQALAARLEMKKHGPEPKTQCEVFAAEKPKEPDFEKQLAEGLKSQLDGLSNQLERDFYSWLKLTHGERIGVQNVKLKLATGCWYIPDFWAVSSNGDFVFYETKGFMRDDAAVKLKVAAALHVWAKFVLVKRDRTQVSGWSFKEIHP